MNPYIYLGGAILAEVIAYAIWSGVGIVLISLLSWGLFGQRLDLPAIIGMMLICAGVLVINLLSRSTPH
ncbi:SMR family transporter [Escherichia coli]